MLFTAVGKITGSEVRPIGGFDYGYPIVEAVQIKLWRETGPGYPGVQFALEMGL